MELLLALATVLLVGKFFAEIFVRLRLPETVAYILSGALLGPGLGLVEQAQVQDFATVGLVLLLFFGGLKGSFQGLRVRYIPFYLFNILLSLSFGWLFALLFGFSSLVGLVIGSTIVTMSISTSLVLFIENDQMDTRVGRMLSSLAVINNLVGVLGVAVLAGFLSAEGSVLANVALIGGKILLFGGVFVLIGWLVPKLLTQRDHLESSAASFTLTIIFAFVIAVLAKQLGFSSVLGAFIGGLVLGQIPHSVSEQFMDHLKLILAGFFGIFYFSMLGMGLDFGALAGGWPFLMLAFLFLAKFFPGFFASRFIGFSWHEAKGLGFALLSISINIGIAILLIGKDIGLVSDELYSIFLMYSVLAVLVTPVLLSSVLRKRLPKAV